MTLRVGAVDLLAVAIADGLAGGDNHAALRWSTEFIWDVDHVEPEERSALLADRPRSTGHPAWDAVLGGIVEMLAHRHGLLVPPWTAEPDRFLAQWWFFSDRQAWRVSAVTNAPAALANRGVFIHAAALESV